ERFAGFTVWPEIRKEFKLVAFLLFECGEGKRWVVRRPEHAHSGLFELGNIVAQFAQLRGANSRECEWEENDDEVLTDEVGSVHRFLFRIDEADLWYGITKLNRHNSRPSCFHYDDKSGFTLYGRRGTM